MLGSRTTGIALLLALVAGMALAQTGEADPPAADNLPGTDQPPTPVEPRRVKTLQEKEELRIFCSQAANRRTAPCEGFAERTTTTAAGGG